MRVCLCVCRWVAVCVCVCVCVGVLRRRGVILTKISLLAFQGNMESEHGVCRSARNNLMIIIRSIAITIISSRAIICDGGGAFDGRDAFCHNAITRTEGRCAAALPP